MCNPQLLCGLPLAIYFVLDVHSNDTMLMKLASSYGVTDNSYGGFTTLNKLDESRHHFGPGGFTIESVCQRLGNDPKIPSLGYEQL